MITSVKIGRARRHIVDMSDAQTFLRTNELVKRLRRKGKRADDERTIFQLTTFYLNKSYQAERLHKLLTNFDFVAAKLVNSYDARRRTYDVQSLISDYEFARDFPEIWDQGSLPLIQRAIELAAHILADDPSQLPEQLLARLLGYEAARKRVVGDVQRFLERAKRYKSAPWLRPLTRSLPDPDGPQLRTVTDHSGQLRAVAIAPRLKRFVSASDSILTVWDFEGREERFAPTDQSDEVTDLIITPDEKYVVVARRNSIIEVWKLETLRKEFTLSGHESAVLALATTPDGRLISASTDKTVKVWDLKSRREVLSLDQGASVHSLALFSDGQRLVVGTSCSLFGSTAENMIKVWDLESGSEYTSGGHDCSIDALAVTPDGKIIIAAINETLKVWDWQNNREVLTLEGHRSHIHSVTVTPNGKSVISSGHDIKVWEIKRGDMLVALKGHYGPVNDIAIMPDGQHLISASSDQTLKIWDLIRAKKSASTGHQESVNALVVTPDSRLAISAAKDHTLKVWDMQHQQVRLTLEGHTDSVSDVAVTADSRRAISASRDGTIKVWDLYTGRELLTLNGQDEHFSALAVTPDGQQIVSATVNGPLKVWDVGRQVERLTLVGDRRTVNAITITPDGKRAITVSDDQTLRVWDMENGVNLQTLQVDSEPHYLVSLDGVDEVEELLSHPIKDEPMTALAVTSDGQRALSGSRNGTLRMWDIESQTELFALRDSPSGITAIAITDRFAFVTSGVPHLSSDNTLRVWDLQKKEVIARFVAESPMNACAVGSDGLTVLAGDMSGRVHFLRLEGV
ncbi:MAG: WD40 repeat domain-containing protein [Ardenticatenaceae bacterium]